MKRSRPRSIAQRGVGALSVVAMLLLITLLSLTYLNRGVAFEQRSAAGQVRATVALEAAEAGLEWASGMLNQPLDVSADCTTLGTANGGFRRKYVLTKWNDAVTPTTDVVSAVARPACRLTAAGVSCSCPAANTATVPTIAGEGASFAVGFEDVAGDAEAVRIISWGCAPTSGGQACNAANAASADANARVEAVLKLKPVLRAAPAAALTCGTTCELGGSYNLVNTDVNTNGVLVNAGDSITSGPGVSLTTLPGQPARNASIGYDASLSDVASRDTTCTHSGMFNAYFGSTVEQYRSAASTKVLSCSSATDCESKLTTAYDAGWRAFYFDTDLQLSGNRTLGSANEPVALVTGSNLTINGTWDIYGLLFSNNADLNALGTGAAILHGAQISCAAYRNNGNGTITYDAEVLRRVRLQSGPMARVPGSWRDFD